MTSRVYQPAPGRWLATEPYIYRDNQWETLDADAFPGAVMASMYAPHYLGEGTIWQRDVSNMPLADNSAVMAKWMWDNTPSPWGLTGSTPWGAKTGLNTSVYGTRPIATYLVDSSHPRCGYQYVDACRATAGTTQAEIDAYLLGKIPWPSFAKPAENGDHGFAVYDIATGIMREYYQMVPADSGEANHWKANAGGYSVAKPGLVDLAETNWSTQMQNGGSAVVCMHNPLGFIGIAEVRQKKINHALAFTTANFAKDMAPSWPAQMSDGKAPADQQPYSPTHGQWARLPANVDPSFNPLTGLPYNPLTQLIIDAAKKYGLVGTDTNAWCHAFNAECGYQEEAMFGKDPWGSGELANILDPDGRYTGRATDVSDFPWYLTEWAPVDWGRPSPDFITRPGEYWPWVKS